jgi:hypothetical protein
MSTSTTLYGGAAHRRVTILDLRAAKERGEKWAMLTSYEQMTAAIFDEAGIPVLLVGDSAGNNFLGEENTIPVTVDELIPLTRAVVRGSQRALVVADLPFGSYESSPEQALATSTRFFKEAGAMAVKLEGAHLGNRRETNRCRNSRYGPSRPYPAITSSIRWLSSAGSHRWRCDFGSSDCPGESRSLCHCSRTRTRRSSFTNFEGL